MSEITLSRKRRIWPWIAGAAILVFAISVVVANHHTDQKAAARTASSPATTAQVGTTGAALQPAVARYLAFAEQTANRRAGSAENVEEAKAGQTASGQRATPAHAPIPAMNLTHDYTSEGLNRLADALDALTGLSADEAAKTLHANAEALGRDAESLQHADLVRASFEAAAQVIAQHDSDAGTQLRQIASSLDTRRPLLKQRDKVQEFFVAAGDAIRALATRS